MQRMTQRLESESTQRKLDSVFACDTDVCTSIADVLDAELAYQHTQNGSHAKVDRCGECTTRPSFFGDCRSRRLRIVVSRQGCCVLWVVKLAWRGMLRCHLQAES
jgi:hypothetical protein